MLHLVERIKKDVRDRGAFSIYEWQLQGMLKGSDQRSFERELRSASITGRRFTLNNQGYVRWVFHWTDKPIPADWFRRASRELPEQRYEYV